MNIIKVSVVEDDAKLRGTIRDFVRIAPGLRYVSGYGSAEEAIAKLPGDRPDVVVMDIRLPGMTGIQCVSELKRLAPEIKVLMLTVFSDGDQLFQAIAAGASGYLLKSTKPDRLLAAIQDVYEGGSPITSSVARKMVDYFRMTHPVAPAAGALSDREESTLKMLAEGLMYKEIADRLGVSIGTVRTFVHRVYEKLHVTNRTDAVLRYLNRDLKKS